jgi:hypothetical protein
MVFGTAVAMDSTLVDAAGAEEVTTAPEDPNLFEDRSTRSRSYASPDQEAIVISGSGARAGKLFDVFVYDADVTLLYDDDGDGFFHGLEVSFDADTTEFATTVYARLYLRRFDEPWSMYFQTPAFSIFGTSPDDDYFVITELLTGYPRDLYDLRIEIYEAGTDALLTSFGPWDSAVVSQLPLEAEYLDKPAATGDSISYSGGGGGLGLIGLSVLCLWRARRPDRDTGDDHES